MNESEIERIYRKLDAMDGQLAIVVRQLNDHVRDCAKDKADLNGRLDALATAFREFSVRIERTVGELRESNKELGERLDATAKEFGERLESAAKEARAQSEAVAKEAREHSEAVAKEARAHSEAVAKEAREHSEAVAKKAREHSDAVAREAREQSEAAAKEARERSEAAAKEAREANKELGERLDKHTEDYAGEKAAVRVRMNLLIGIVSAVGLGVLAVFADVVAGWVSALGWLE